jgi:rSAM/selenodomain-associated transferase 1
MPFMATSAQRVLGLFAKWPAPGLVKTRLCGSDPLRGARIARAFLLDTLERFAATEAHRTLVYTPPEAADGFHDLAAGRFDLTPQGDGDLGHRLARFIATQQAEAATSIVVIGADSPTLPAELVEQAFAQLQSADLVLGPACDGGYYLLGCGPRLPPIFDRIDWGGPEVLRQTIDSLSDPTWHLGLLPPWYDVDTPEDWAMLRGHLAALRRAGIDPGAPHTEALCCEAPP